MTRLIIAALLLAGCDDSGSCDQVPRTWMPHRTEIAVACWSPGRVVLEPLEGDRSANTLMCRCPRGAADGGSR